MKPIYVLALITLLLAVVSLAPSPSRADAGTSADDYSTHQASSRDQAGTADTDATAARNDASGGQRTKTTTSTSGTTETQSESGARDTGEGAHGQYGTGH